MAGPWICRSGPMIRMTTAKVIVSIPYTESYIAMASCSATLLSPVIKCLLN